MPRLTNKDYVLRHHFLAHAWHELDGLFLHLLAEQQWALHLYYQTQSTAPEYELVAIRRLLHRQHPSLPQRAGKAYKQLAQAYELATLAADGDMAAFNQALRDIAGMPANAQRHGDRVISVQALVHPEVDTVKLARALVKAVEEQVKGGMTPRQASGPAPSFRRRSAGRSRRVGDPAAPSERSAA
jgi:ribonucleotide reductase alpha subunit